MNKAERDGFERGDQVFFKCTNPATGWIVRVARDGSWADVRWDSGMDCRYVRRTSTENILKLNPILDRLARDPLARAFVPETRAALSAGERGE